MKVAVVVVEYNDADETIKYINKISSYKIIQKIVVVDNFSNLKNNFEKLKILQSDKVDVIQTEKNGGYSYGNNFGIKYLEKKYEKFDYIIISNPDIDIEEFSINKCIQVLKENESVAVVAPRMFNCQNSPIRRSAWKIRTFGLDIIHSTRLLELLFYKKLRDGEYSAKDYEKEILEVESISGAFFVMKYDILKEIGYFDENVFLFYEEDILSQKIKNKGYKIFSINDEKFIHYESQTIGKTFSYYKKVEQLYKSKMYYQINYNHINNLQKFSFIILNIFRKLELLIEIPIRKILKK